MSGREIRSFVAALAAVLLLSLPLHAQQFLNATGVVFAFVPQVVAGNQTWMLVPIPTEKVRTDVPMQASVPAAFGLLRAGKPATYGNSSVRVTDADLAARQVTVILDPAARASGNALIIAAECVYTFTQLGADKVVFPGFNDAGMTRGDIPYAGYRLQVPMWQALPPARFFHSDVVLPDGSTLASREFYERVNKGDQALLAKGLDYLRGQDPIAMFAALSTLAPLNVTGFEAAVIPLLKRPDPALRDAALASLTGSKSNAAWDAVVEVMRTDTEPGIRARAAAALARSPVESYRFFEVLFRAANGDPAGRVAAVRELGTVKDDRATAEAVRLLESPETAVAEAAVGALTARKAWDALQQAMTRETLAPAIRVAAATALGREGEPRYRVAGLRFRAMQMVGEPAVATVDAIASLPGVEVRPVIEEFLAHPDDVVKSHAARLLAGRPDRASLKALSAAAGAAEGRFELRATFEAAAYTILASEGYDGLKGFLAGPDVFLRRAAYRALGTVAQGPTGNPRMFEALREGLTAREPEVRGAAVRGLAEYRSAEALELVLPLADDPEVQVHADLASALGRFSDPAFSERVNPLVTTYLQSGDAIVVAGALESTAALGLVRLLTVVLSHTEHPDRLVRAAALRACAAMSSEPQERPIINALIGRLRDPEVSIRVLAANLLGGFSNELAVLGLSQVVNEPVPALRYAAIEALGRTGSPAAGQVLGSMLEDGDREIRLSVIGALRILNRRDTLPLVQAAMARQSDPVTVEAERALVEHLEANGR